MTPDEKLQLIELLKKFKEANFLIPNAPQDLFFALHTVAPIPTAEVIITRTGRDFLLVHREDEHWHGWHIPGGYMGYKETLPDACNRVAQKELGISVKFDHLVDAYIWQDHPYGAPVSLICVCKTDEQPKEGRFFTEIPENMIPNQDKFIRLFLEDSKKIINIKNN